MSLWNHAIGARRAALAACAALALAGCAEDQARGYIQSQSAIQQVPVGSSQEQVLVVLGSPSTTATLKGDVYYYISQKTHRPVQFMKPEITDQKVLAVYFDKNHKVEKIANYGLQDGRVVDFYGHVTPTAGSEETFLEHVFKGVLSND